MVNSDGEDMFSDQYNENVMLQVRCARLLCCFAIEALQNELQKLRVRANVLQETNNALNQRTIQMKEEIERQRLLATVPTVDADGNIDDDAKQAFEATLKGIIDTYVTDNEQLNTRVSEALAECEEYKKKYNALRLRQEEMGGGGGHLGMLDSHHHSSSFNDNPVVQSARQELDDQKKLVESKRLADCVLAAAL